MMGSSGGQGNNQPNWTRAPEKAGVQPETAPRPDRKPKPPYSPTTAPNEPRRINNPLRFDKKCDFRISNEGSQRRPCVEKHGFWTLFPNATIGFYVNRKYLSTDPRPNLRAHWTCKSKFQAFGCQIPRSAILWIVGFKRPNIPSVHRIHGTLTRKGAAFTPIYPPQVGCPRHA